MDDRAKHIQLLNDTFRLDPQRWGKLFITAGIEERGAAFVEKAILAAKVFDIFTPDNDPYGEHDFASFVVDGITCYFKIDYYDKQMECGSDDPADQAKTLRVMTVALMEEY